MRNAVLLSIVAFLLLSACVPNRKIVFLQKPGEINKKKEPTDTLNQEYQLVDFDYKIQSYDLISVRYQTLTPKVFDFLNQQISGFSQGGGNSLLMIGELVDENGEIQMQGVGKVKVAGLTIFEIQDKLQALANQFLESTIVRVRLLNYRATILGEVNHEGHLIFQNTNRVSLPEALGLAAGLTDLADRSNIKVIRQNGSKVEVFYVDLLREDFVKSPYYYVHQNDVIIVPPLKQRPFRKYFAQNLALVFSGLSLMFVIISLRK